MNNEEIIDLENLDIRILDEDELEAFTDEDLEDTLVLEVNHDI